MASFFIVVMVSVLLNPSVAFSSHFDTGGAPLSELSWPSSLAVVAVSFSGLFTFIFLMLACLCCKKGDISFKEFENNEGEEHQADRPTLASTGSQDGPDVYVLPLTEVSLPVSKQPCRSIQLLKSADLGRHSLLYFKELGHGWFGKVLLGEVNAGLSTIQVVVKELKASASVQGQMQFLEEAQPYRTLQHPALLQCLAQCTDVTPYLLIMEYCPLGDVKGYLRSCRAEGSATPDPLTLQRMACEISSGLQYLHKHNYIHSDLALRNCLLTSEMSVKIGDYGLSHSRYKDDYFVTADQIWVPLRWIAPELIDEVHGNLLIVDQTKASNVWSLGVTIWELFELGNQPYRHYSDRQVLTYAVKEQQLKLPKPLLEIPLSERWYEVMQFCWLQPEQRPVVEEVCLLLNYLCAKDTSEKEEEFETRWNSLKPSLDTSSSNRTPVGEAPSCNSSFPLLEHFSMADSFQSENGDEILTVTETRHGLNFEYKWEQARSEQPYCSVSPCGNLGSRNSPYQDMYYPISSSAGSCKSETLTLGVSPSCYKLDYPGVVPVLSAHSPSVSSEYYIRIEEPVDCNISLEEVSPGHEASNLSLPMRDFRSPTNSRSGSKDCKGSISDSDCSPSIALTLKPHQRDLSLIDSVERVSPNFSPIVGNRLSPLGDLQEFRHGSESPCHTGIQESSHAISISLSSPSLGQCDPYVEANQRIAENSMSTKVDYDLLSNIQKNVSRPHDICFNVEAGDCLVMGSADPEDDDHLFTNSEAVNWMSNHSTNNNTLNFDARQTSRDTKFDMHHTAPFTQVEWQRPMTGSNLTCLPYTDLERISYIHLSSEGETGVEPHLKSQVRLADRSTTPAQDIKVRSDGPKAGYGEKIPDLQALSKSVSECSQTMDSWVEPSCSSISLVNIDDCSDDDIMDITSEVFEASPVDYAEVADIDLARIPFRTEIPSRDPDDIATGSSPCEALSPDAYHTSIQPKSLDSGYDTENNESPEFVMRDLEGKPVLSTSVESECEMVLQMDLEESVDDVVLTPSSSSNSGGRDQYRDSAYFSDYDVENDKSPCEGERSFFDNRLENDFFDSKPANDDTARKAGGNNGPPVSQRENRFHFARVMENAESAVLRGNQCLERRNMDPSSMPLSAPIITVLAPFPPEMGGCLTKESTQEDGLVLESEQSGEEPASECSFSTASEESTTTQRADTMEDPANSVSVGFFSADLLGSTSTVIEFSEELDEDDHPECLMDGKDEEKNGELEEEVVKGSPLGVKRDSSLDNILPALPEDLDLPAPLGKLEEADQEDTDDSDESDEELRSYNVQEQSEESEEEFTTVPVVVSERSSARHLRSLLKMPSLLTQSFCDELDQKKKAVSFFDDVTVFLFDQDSPTGELADDQGIEPNEPPADGEDAQQQENICASDNTSNGNESDCEKSEVFEWGNDSTFDKIGTPQNSPVKSPDEKPALQFSRFSVSRFSITQVSDTDIETMGDEDQA
ncbi:serine/threonine-protein kinase LMTK1 [Trichomycterus rosablanca]|uniref:serine/threonine-protein kinase LMTK1 n=1 Tax=Trichomycterus rosablanca TaxID=2290929 RepID=UPI002F35DA8B